MTTKTQTIENILSDLKRSDGEKWIRILGQYHPQYHEVPVWVLVENRGQIEAAIRFLQEKLKPLQSDEDDVTVSFVSYNGDKEYSFGMFKGGEFFIPDAINYLYEEPFVNQRTQSVFDAEYPMEKWSLN
ncbi:hypothetical protein AGR1B_pa0223 [Agrobacterium fabacearum S56]|uniref:hypothetical protein n=1 Tax=Agrobacterium tumefaciens TaxID=358 RepID=UPI0009BB7B0C|nr:hypothetical protein [Agrobacterium tumefaciens]CUX06979.1 hypothetical protein AGR1B_pa0223 [Agrobacterium fabacearum S56]